MAVPNAPLLNPDDTYIPVMGATGTGKSHFINLCTGNAAQSIGHGLESYTQAVTAHDLQRSGRTIHLIDTPGFNDTHRTDADILGEFAFWLKQAAERNTRIAGVIYIHSILAPRLQGSALQGLNVFKQMCGSDAYAGVIMLTTHWDAVASQPHGWGVGVARQRELEQGVWSEVIARGGSLLGLVPATADTALGVIDRIVGWNRHFTFKLQREIYNDGIELRKTAAGKLLSDRYEDLVKVFEQRLEDLSREIKDALNEQDRRHAADLRQEFEEVRTEIAKQTQAVKELSASMREVSAKQMKKAEADRVRLETMMLQTQAELESLRNMPPQVKVIRQPVYLQQQQDIRRIQETRVASRSSPAETVSAVAGVAGAVLAGAALCTIM